MRTLAVTAAAAAALLSFGSAARADISVCNDFIATIYVAFAYPNGNNFTAGGWWNIGPNKCLSVYFPFTGPTLYYSADSGEYRVGRRSYHDHWGNKQKLYVTTREFTTDDAVHYRRGTKSEMFSLVEISSQLQGKPVQITLHFQKGSTSINIKAK
jgi:uncharacterized membrane protein